MSLVSRHAAHIDQLAAEARVDPRALRAVIAVEAGPEGVVSGRPVVRLEVHRLWLGAPRDLRPQVDARFRVAGPRAWQGHEYRLEDGSWAALHRPGRGGQALEHEALAVARAIHEQAAVEATSWGAGQLLGLHWRLLGYASPTAMASAQSAEETQLHDLVVYLVATGAVAHLRAHDWRAFARAYNGSGQVDWYAGRLAAAYEAA